MEDFESAREAMVDRQVRPADVTRRGIADAMLQVPRERFVPSSKRAIAYAGESVSIGDGRWLLDPRVFGKLLDAAEIDRNDAILDVGCGLGYSAAVLSKLCRGVVAVEENEAMARSADTTLAALDVTNVAVLTGALAEGAASEAPFDVIIIEGAVEQVPEALFDQLAEDGRLVAIWREGQIGRAKLSVKSGGIVSSRWVFDANAEVLPGFGAESAFSF